MVKLFKMGWRKAKAPTILAMVLVCCEALLEILMPRTMANLVDFGITLGDMDAVIKYGLTLVGLVCLSITCGITANICAAKASTTFAHTLRNDMYEHIQGFSFANIDKFSPAGLVTRLTTDVTNIQNTFQQIVIGCFRSPSMLIFGVIMAFRINAQLALVFVAAIPFMLVMFVLIFKKAIPHFKKLFYQYDHMNAVVEENIDGMRTVKSYVREKQQIDRFDVEVKKQYHFSLNAEKYICLVNPVIYIAIYGSIVTISWIGAKLIILGGSTMTTGLLMSLVSYVTQILLHLMFISMWAVMIVMSKASADRIKEVLDENSDLTSPSDGLKEVKNGSIDFKDVSFAYYKGKNVLEDINLHIKSGETIGILGGTGSSKSTLIQLVPRLYDCATGNVKVGGHDVKEYDLDVLRNNVSVVLQKNTLFSGTIKDNLRWGNENATDEQIIDACKKAHAHEFIEKFPDGYDTKIEQGGVNVSGGQKQRLCIARALLKQPKILILDDSTSAVDMKTDAAIRDTFKNDLKGVTKLIVGQRISSIQNADRILVLDNGHINGFDTHENLLKSNKIYQEVYYTQMKGVE